MFTEAYYVCPLRRIMYVHWGVLCMFTEAYYVCSQAYYVCSLRRFMYVL